jgi:hypothetical protein
MTKWSKLEVPKDPKEWPERARTSLEVIKAGFSLARATQAELKNQLDKIKADRDLTPEARQRRSNELRARILPEFEGRMKLYRATVEKQIEVTNAALQEHGEVKPHEAAWDPAELTDKHQRISAWHSRVSQDLIARLERHRAEDLADRLIAEDPAGAKLMTVAARALQGSDVVQQWAWQQVSDRVELLGSEPARLAFRAVIAESRDRRIANKAPEDLKLEADCESVTSSALLYFDSIVNDFKSPAFERDGSPTLRSAVPQLGEYFQVEE